MKKIARLISLILVAAMLMTLLPVSALAEENEFDPTGLTMEDNQPEEENLSSENLSTQDEGMPEEGSALTADEGVLTISDAGETIPLTDWLKYMPDDLPISRINMLASHDSGCYDPFPVSVLCATFPALVPLIGLIYSLTDGAARTQQGSITYQLNRGARVFDVRGDYFWVNSSTDPFDMWINHKLPMRKSTFKALRVEDVFDEIQKFLKNHSDETVILCMNCELGSDTSKELLKKLMQYSPCLEYPEFIYYEGESDVPLLRDVRGKCVVLNMKDTPTTEYANHCTAPPKEKAEYLKHFFETHNNGNPEFSNKLALYKKDIFCRQSEYENQTGIEKDPQVKEISYTANVIGKYLPIEIANHVKSIYGKDEYFKSEVRYGWVYMDFIGDGRDPVNGIIKSNLGCTNFNITLDTSDPVFSKFAPDFCKNSTYKDYAVYGIYGDNRVPMDLRSYNPQINKDLKNNRIEIKIPGLPLYAPDGSYYDYEFVLKIDGLEETFRLRNTQKNTDRTYAVRDGKWCGQEITLKAEAYADTMEFPLEIQFIIDADSSYKESKNHDELFRDYIHYMILGKITESGKNDTLWVYGPSVPYHPQFTDFELVGDGTDDRYYKTRMVNLPRHNDEGEEYTYDLRFCYFIGENEGGGLTVFTGEIVEGTGGCQRLVIHVVSKLKQKSATSTIQWWDGGDVYGMRNSVLTRESEGIQPRMLPIEIVGKSATMAGSVYVFGQHDDESIITEGNETKVFKLVNKYDGNGWEYDYTYKYKDSYLGGYYQKVAVAGNDATFGLFGKADLTVVWDGEIPEGIIDRTVTLTPTPAEGAYSFNANVSSETTSGSAKVWTSEEQFIPLFKNEKEAAEFSVNLTDALKVSGFKATAGVIIDIDEETGIPIRHFMLFYDNLGTQTLVSGSVTWIDGTYIKDHREDNRKIQIEKYIEGQFVDYVAAASMAEMKWYENHYSISLPKYTEEDPHREITYKVKMPDGMPEVLPIETSAGTQGETSYFNGYLKQQSEDTFDIIYTRVVYILLKGNNWNNFSYPERLKLYKNGSLDTSANTKYDTGSHIYYPMPIADENNVLYSYSVKYTDPDPKVLVEYHDPVWEDERTKEQWDIEINTYAFADEVQLPVKVSVEGDVPSVQYKFILEGITDAGFVNKTLTLDENTNGCFTIPSQDLKKHDVPYRFTIYQDIPDVIGMEYDYHTSLVEAKVSYDKDSKQVIKLKWTIPAEQREKASLFENKAIDPKYIALFEDEEGKVLDKVEFEKGQTPTTSIIPQKEETVEFRYEFASWKQTSPTRKDFEEVPGWNHDRVVVYKPVFTNITKQYTAKFVDDDGEKLLYSNKVDYGKVPEYKGRKPEKAADREYTYKFDSWMPEIVAIEEDTVYTAFYDRTPIDYKFTKGDGSVYTKGSKEGLEFKVSGPEDCLLYTFIDDNYDEVKIEDENPFSTRDAKADETLLTLSREYLDSLGAGKHTITAVYRNGSVPVASFTVNDAPHTGDPNNVGLWILLMAISIACAVLVLIIRRKYN